MTKAIITSIVLWGSISLAPTPSAKAPSTTPSTVYVVKKDAPEWARQYWKACQDSKASEIDRIARNIKTLETRMAAIKDPDDVRLVRLKKLLDDSRKELGQELDSHFIDEPDLIRPSEGAGKIIGTVLQTVGDRHQKLDANLAGDHAIVWVVHNPGEKYHVGEELRATVIADGQQEEDGKRVPRLKIVHISDYLIDESKRRQPATK